MLSFLDTEMSEINKLRRLRHVRVAVKHLLIRSSLRQS